MAVRAGFCIAAISALYILYLLHRNAIVGDLSIGWPSIVASIYLMGGLTLSAIGIVGIYIGNIFAESKNRPIYVIGDILNDHQERTTDK